MEIRNKMRESQSTILDPAILLPAIGQSFVKLNPRLMIKNPVMFVVEIVAVLTTVIFLRDLGTGGAHLGFTFQIIVWLWVPDLPPGQARGRPGHGRLMSRAQSW